MEVAGKVLPLPPHLEPHRSQHLWEVEEVGGKPAGVGSIVEVVVLDIFEDGQDSLH